MMSILILKLIVNWMIMLDEIKKCSLHKRSVQKEENISNQRLISMLGRDSEMSSHNQSTNNLF